MEQALKTHFHFKFYVLKITLGDTDLFFWFTEFFHLYLISEDGVKEIARIIPKY